jgi:hypothetical protein
LRNGNGPMGLWPQLANSTVQFTISAFHAHTAMRPTLNHSRPRD